MIAGGRHKYFIVEQGGLDYYSAMYSVYPVSGLFDTVAASSVREKFENPWRRNIRLAQRQRRQPRNTQCATTGEITG